MRGKEKTRLILYERAGDGLGFNAHGREDHYMASAELGMVVKNSDPTDAAHTSVKSVTAPRRTRVYRTTSAHHSARTRGDADHTDPQASLSPGALHMWSGPRG
jgi:hypothetical protein